MKDEDAFIGETIASVVGQSLLPLQWVVVSDGSTDRTEEIVRAAAAQHPWIRLVCLSPRAERSFAAVVHATEAGVRALTVTEYQYIGLLDSDVRFGPDYFENVIERFEAYPRLGLGGGMVVDVGHPKNHPPRNRQDVPGAAQFFRRQCFEKLAGLFAIPEGGWDALTCVRARMLGYETRLFTDLVMDHLKPRNIAEGGVLGRQAWRMGVRYYAVGYHPVFEVFKCMDRLTEHPPIVSAFAWLAGYVGAGMERRRRLVPDDIKQFIYSGRWGRMKQTLGLSSRVAPPVMETGRSYSDSARDATDG